MLLFSLISECPHAAFRSRTCSTQRQNLQYSRPFLNDTDVEETGPANESTSVAGHYTELAHERNMAMMELAPTGSLGEFYFVRKLIESSTRTLAQTYRFSLIFVVVPKAPHTTFATSLLAVIRRHGLPPALSSRPRPLGFLVWLIKPDRPPIPVTSLTPMTSSIFSGEKRWMIPWPTHLTIFSVPWPLPLCSTVFSQMLMRSTTS